jgi:tetratricopeptide (TPR) repeat protein
MRRGLLCLMALWSGIAVPAHAAWVEATTDHFVVDADAPEAKVSELATRLERFDAALRLLYGTPDDPSRKSNRVHIYAAAQSVIDSTSGSLHSGSIGGFYKPRAGGSVIMTAALSSNGAGQMDAQVVLLHEYSHHFMFSSFPVAYPLWFSEGFAEFNSHVDFRPDGALDIGLPDKERANVLLGHTLIYADGSRSDSGSALPIAQLLDPPRRLLSNGAFLNMIYGRGWLLTNYLMLSSDRRLQLSAYLDGMNRGMSSMDAAKKAFGNVNQLGLDLATYLRNRRLLAPFRVPAPTQPIKVTTRVLTVGAAAMMPVHMRSTAGVSPAEAKALVLQAERRAAPYPDDARVQVELAEAEFDAHNDDAADAAVDRALKIDPANATALLYKGRVAIDRASTAKAADAATWTAARGWYVRANRLDPNAAEPLILYFQSFPAAHVQPSESALQGLERAEVLAPEDSGVRWQLAKYLLSRGDSSSARDLLQPIAFAPHERENGDVSRAVIERIDAGDIEGARKKMELRTEADAG